MLPKYKVVSDTQLDKFEEDVLNLTYGGWRLHGGVSVCYTPDGILYSQALTFS